MTPDAMKIERLAIAMAAGNGIDWVQHADHETRQDYRRAASAGLLWLGLRPNISAPAHVAATLATIAETFRRAADAMDGAEPGTFREDQIAAVYAQATEAERVRRVILGLAEEAAPAVTDDAEEAI